VLKMFLKYVLFYDRAALNSLLKTFFSYPRFESFRIKVIIEKKTSRHNAWGNIVTNIIRALDLIPIQVSARLDSGPILVQLHS